MADKLYRARVEGQMLALRTATKFLTRYPGGDIRPMIAEHLSARLINGQPYPLVAKMFKVAAERDAFLDAYQGTLIDFVS